MKKLLQKFRLYPDTLDGKAVLISFLIINFAFLFHTLNFMWGNHDVKFIKEELLFSSGLFEGRFTQFIPYRLLTGGQILPLLNNLLGFAFLTAALWLLAKYWNIKSLWPDTLCSSVFLPPSPTRCHGCTSRLSLSAVCFGLFWRLLGFTFRAGSVLSGTKYSCVLVPSLVFIWRSADILP